MARQPTNRPSREKKRVPVSGNRDVLTARNIPEGYVPRWVNDEDDRISKFQDAGYEFVTDKNVTVGDRHASQGTEVGSVISKRVGGGKTAYLMVQHKDWYDEDQEAKQKLVREREVAITKAKEGEGQYGSIEISR